jgi:hypothetical protein
MALFVRLSCHMQWIDDMFVTMDKAKSAEAAKRQVHRAPSDPKEHVKGRSPGSQDAWKALVSAIKNDVNYFNNHKRRKGQTAVCISDRRFECEVYLPGMLSKRMVVTLDNNDLRVSVHPDFPDQQLVVTIEPDPDGKHSFWVLGGAVKENRRLSVEQLSEDLLKPILSSADIS